MWEKRITCRLLVRKPEGRMELGEVGWGDVDWIGLAQDRNSCCEFGIEPSGSIKCWETIKWPKIWWPLE
jgi:hypothetical protein